MPLEDIDSPPYPGDGTTTELLFSCLKALRVWVMKNRDDMNVEIGQALIPEVIKIPDKKAYLTQAVIVQIQHFITIRRLREEWDHLIRLYEEDWMCKPCVRSRAMLLQNAALLINDAFVPFELREAQEHRRLEKMQRAFERITEAFGKIMHPEDKDPE